MELFGSKFGEEEGGEEAATSRFGPLPRVGARGRDVGPIDGQISINFPPVVLVSE